MKLGLGKRAKLIRKYRKRHMIKGMELTNQEKIITRGEKETYK